MDNAKAAFEYVERGWAVVPLTQKGIPYFTEWQHKPLTEGKDVARWWGKHPRANVGIVCGASDLVVVDQDVKNGKDGIAEWENLKTTHGFDDDTLKAQTKSDGRHVYYLVPKGVNLGNGKANHLAPGVDTRMGANYVIAPPSFGGKYKWLNDLEPQPLPQQLLGLLKPKPQEKKPPLPGSIPEGGRNDALVTEAARLRHMGWSSDEIHAALCALNQSRCDPPKTDEEIRRMAEWAGKFSPGSPDSWYTVGAAPVQIEAHNTDMGNATRLARRHGADLRHCAPLGGWMAWGGQVWETGADLAVMAMAKETVLNMYALLSSITDDAKRIAFAKWCAQSEHINRLRAMVALAASEPGIPAEAEEFDANSWLLNVGNGMLDLKTYDLLPHDRDRLITKLAPVTYDPQAACPRWEKFIGEIMAGKGELIKFVQKALGWSLTGDVSEDVLFVLWGSGANGKTTLVSVINGILGDGYARTTPMSTLMMKRDGGISNDIARLKGARFVSAIESERGRKLAESLVKALTGGDRQVARFLYKEYVEFAATFKIFLATNHKPVIEGTDHAIWRRIRLIPFTVKIPPDEQDLYLDEKLLQEASGILNWLLEGLKMWKAEGLGNPEPIKNATQEYRTEMDQMARFFDERCKRDPNAAEQAGVLYTAYKEWCQANGEQSVSSVAFSARLLEEDGITRDMKGPYRFYQGISLIPDPGATIGGTP